MRTRLLIFALVLALVSCGSDALTESGAEFSIAPGDSFTIRLDSNPSTGYRWELAPLLDEDIVVQIGEEFVAGADSGDGSGGVQEYTFEGVGDGSTVIELVELDDTGGESRSRSFPVTVSG